MDLGDKYLVRPDALKRGKLLGRGAFGFVFASTCSYQMPSSGVSHDRGSNTSDVSGYLDNNSGQTGMRKLMTRYMDVALKMLEPVDPGPSSRPSAQSAYKAAASKWTRDPLQYSCKVIINNLHFSSCSNPISVSGSILNSPQRNFFLLMFCEFCSNLFENIRLGLFGHIHHRL
jgi:hypothetical protein